MAYNRNAMAKIGIDLKRQGIVMICGAMALMSIDCDGMEWFCVATELRSDAQDSNGDASIRVDKQRHRQRTEKLGNGKALKSVAKELRGLAMA